MVTSILEWQSDSAGDPTCIAGSAGTACMGVDWSGGVAGGWLRSLGSVVGGARPGCRKVLHQTHCVSAAVQEEAWLLHSPEECGWLGWLILALSGLTDAGEGAAAALRYGGLHEAASASHSMQLLHLAHLPSTAQPASLTGLHLGPTTLTLSLLGMLAFGAHSRTLHFRT